MMSKSSFTIREIPAYGMNSGIYDNITFVVSDLGEILFTREYTRHIVVAQRAKVSNSKIAWGGIVSPNGQWIRPSFDFGDAPTVEDRDLVVSIIKSAL